LGSTEKVLNSGHVSGCLVTRSPSSELRALWALINVDLIHLRRYLLNFLIGLFTPFFLLLTYYLTVMGITGGDLTQFSRLAGTRDFMAYLVASYLFVGYVSNALWSMGESLRGMMVWGVFEVVIMTPIRRATLLIAWTFTSFLFTTIYTLMVLTMAWLVFGVSFTGNLLLVLLVLLLTVISLYGFGFFYAGFAILLKESHKFTSFIQNILPLLCGFTYSILVLPREVQVISRIIPLTYSIDTLRHALFDSPTLIPLSHELLILLISALILPILGYWTYLRLESKAKREGTLGRY